MPGLPCRTRAERKEPPHPMPIIRPTRHGDGPSAATTPPAMRRRGKARYLDDEGTERDEAQIVLAPGRRRAEHDWLRYQRRLPLDEPAPEPSARLWPVRMKSTSAGDRARTARRGWAPEEREELRAAGGPARTGNRMDRGGGSDDPPEEAYAARHCPWARWRVRRRRPVRRHDRRRRGHGSAATDTTPAMLRPLGPGGTRAGAG